MMHSIKVLAHIANVGDKPAFDQLFFVGEWLPVSAVRVRAGGAPMALK
ncbi:MAG: hypothetical protein ACRCUH_06915 [Shewanella sp.]